jgi:hypothetical protein
MLKQFQQLHILVVGVQGHFPVTTIQIQGRETLGSGERIHGDVDPRQREAMLLATSFSFL